MQKLKDQTGILEDTGYRILKDKNGYLHKFTVSVPFLSFFFFF